VHDVRPVLLGDVPESVVSRVRAHAVSNLSLNPVSVCDSLVLVWCCAAVTSVRMRIWSRMHILSVFCLVFLRVRACVRVLVCIRPTCWE
jgi:hypothetical protein